MTNLPTISLIRRPLSREAFAPFGTVIEATDDGVPFGPDDARLDLRAGTPRLYVMRLEDKPPRFDRITRHRSVTQCLAAVAGASWQLAVAAPIDDESDGGAPVPDDIVAFEIPGDVAVALHRGTWHAGPFFTRASTSFFNLELSDTNVVDHHTVRLDERYGRRFEILP